MIITAMGYVLLPLGLFFLILMPNCLIYAAVFFSGFSGSAVAIFGEDWGMQPSYYFVFLWIVYRVVKGIRIRSILKEIKENYFFFFFLLYSTISIIIPIFADRRNIIIINVDGEITNLTFSITCITQLCYLWFCFVTFHIFIEFIKEDIIERSKKIESSYLMGAIAFSCVTFYQIFSFKFGFPFDELFRQNIHGNIQGNRIYGPCIEASMMAYYLLSLLPIAVRSKKIKYRILLIVVIGLGVYSVSSTFLVGLVLWMPLEFILRNKFQKIKIQKKQIVYAFIVIGIFIIVYGVIDDYIHYAWNLMMMKFSREHTSGFIRAGNLQLLINAFMKAPVFGVGFGTCRGTDLFSTWLAETGLVGMCLISFFLVQTFLRKKIEIKYMISNILVWVAMMISVPEPYNLFVWILLSIAVVNRGARKQVSNAIE